MFVREKLHQPAPLLPVPQWSSPSTHFLRKAHPNLLALRNMTEYYSPTLGGHLYCKITPKSTKVWKVWHSHEKRIFVKGRRAGIRKQSITQFCLSWAWVLCQVCLFPNSDRTSKATPRVWSKRGVARLDAPSALCSVWSAKPWEDWFEDLAAGPISD